MENRRECHTKSRADSCDGLIGRKERDPMAQVAILVCAPMPPHAPFFVSDNAASLLGYESHEIIGNTSFWMNVVHAEDTPQLLSGFFHLFTRGSHIYDYRFRQKDGSTKRLLVELHLHRRRKRGPITMMAFLREPVVTDTVLRGEVQPTVPSAGNDFTRLTIDSRRRIREAGPGIEALCGRTPKELIGAHALDLIPPDYAHLANDAFSRITGQSDPKPHRFWNAIQHRDGSLRFIAAEGSKSSDRAGAPTIIVKCHDISGLVALDAKSRVRCATRLFSVISRDNDAPRQSDSRGPLDGLTAREREILYLTVEGLSSTRVGSRLSISPRTVEAHRAHIMNKLGVHSLSQLIRYTVSCLAHPESF